MKLFHPPIVYRVKKANILINGCAFCVQVKKNHPSLDLSKENDFDDRKYLKNSPIWAPFEYDGDILIDKENLIEVCFIYNSQGEIWKLLNAKIDNSLKEISFSKCILLSESNDPSTAKLWMGLQNT